MTGKKLILNNMNSQNIEEKILETIKEKHLTPKPKWQFLLKDYLVWGSGLISLISGSFAFAVIIHMIITNDWDVYEYINNSLLGFILVTLPYFWLVFLALFTVIAHYNFKHTKKGYRYHLRTIVIISVTASIVLGTLLYNIGVGQAIDEALSQKLPLYNQFINQRKSIWVRPEKGVLGGVIILIIDDNHFQIKDFHRKMWQVDALRAAKHPLVEIVVGNRIRIIGRPVNENTFEAQLIMPWLMRDKPLPPPPKIPERIFFNLRIR